MRRKQTLLDRQIETIFYRTCSGIQINILDLGKIFAAGRLAAAAGTDIETAIVSCVAQLRQN